MNSRRTLLTAVSALLATGTYGGAGRRWRMRRPLRLWSGPRPTLTPVFSVLTAPLLHRHGRGRTNARVPVTRTATLGCVK